MIKRLIFVFAILLFGCAQGPQTPNEEEEIVMETRTPTPVSEEFKVVAYVTTNVIAETIPYEKLTHINYSFLIPNDDGTFARLINGWKLKNIVEEAHKHDVQVLISVGGWGWDKEFEMMAADDATRATFVANLKDIVDEYGLDGADVDWEYPKAGESAENYLKLMQEIDAAMPDKLITTAVVSHGSNAEGVPDETFEIFDFVNVMTYDDVNHGSMEQFDTGLNYWLERGLSPHKLVIGLPFYSRPGGIPYSKIVEQDPEAAFLDLVNPNGTEEKYNGIPTIQRKTERALDEVGGVMFWTLDYDASGELSLLGVIDQLVRSEK
ncbi:MAG: glycosyl hydrolase family 18 protein [Chloroflexota bacterium]